MRQPHVERLPQVLRHPRLRGSLILWGSFVLHTWEHLPPVAVLKSVHKTADLGSFMDTVLVWIELRTSAVLWTDPRTADLSSSMDTFRSLHIFSSGGTLYLVLFVCVCRVCLSVCNTFLSMRFRDSQQLGSVSRLWPLILASNSFMGATHHVGNLLIVQNLILKSEQLKCDSDISRTMYTPSKFLVH